MFDQLSYLEGDPDWSMFPRYWDVEAAYDWDFTFEFDDSVEQQLRAVIDGLEVYRLEDDWTFENLALGW